MQFPNAVIDNLKKSCLSFFLLILTFYHSHAQNHFFVEVGINTESNIAVSGIYSLDVSKKWGLGIGATLQQYEPFSYSSLLRADSGPYTSKTPTWRPSIYADVRREYHHRKNEVDWFLDFGGVVYQNNYAYRFYTANISNAWYESIGAGYYQKLKKSRVSPYVSLRLQNTVCHEIEKYGGDEYNYWHGEFYLMLAIGVKF